MLKTYLTIACLHLGGGDLNEVNPGVIVEYNSVIAGGYKNSFSEESYLAGKKIQFEAGEDFEFGAIVGGVTGYDYPWTVGGVTAFAAPYVSYDMGHVQPTILMLGDAVTFSVGIEF